LPGCVSRATLTERKWKSVPGRQCKATSLPGPASKKQCKKCTRRKKASGTGRQFFPVPKTCPEAIEQKSQVVHKVRGPIFVKTTAEKVARGMEVAQGHGFFGKRQLTRVLGKTIISGRRFSEKKRRASFASAFNVSFLPTKLRTTKDAGGPKGALAWSRTAPVRMGKKKCLSTNRK